MTNLLHTRGPLLLSLTVFGMGICTLAVVAITSPQKLAHDDHHVGYGLITVANAANP